jgi:hypothetical protein
VITVAPTAEQFADDQAVAGFKAYAQAVARTFQTSGGSQDALFDVVTGRSAELLRGEAKDYAENGWRLVGSPTLVVVGVLYVDDAHRHVLTCEHDSASYPVDRDGVVVRPFEDRWLPNEQWMVLVDGTWVLEDFYAGEHDCEGVR